MADSGFKMLWKGLVRDGLPKVHTLKRWNRQDALVPSSPSFVVLPRSEEQWHVASDSSGYSWDAEIEFVISRARRVKTVNLDAVFARAAYKRPSATLVENCQLG